jgi:2,3-bisphosphoglycerate-dependent phosphoglycerate mutase
VGTLVLLRHGESEWNSGNLFTGWADPGLTAAGEEQARSAGRRLRAAGLLPDVAHSSVLTRAVRTTGLVLEAAGQAGVPVHRHWRLNERHYGALQGMDKKEVRRVYGDELFRLWRRSHDVAPPPAGEEQARGLAADPRYAGLPPGTLPRTESLADVQARLLPYWFGEVAPGLREGRTVLVVGHSNSLRALMAHLDGLGPRELMALNVPTGAPLRYDLGDDLLPVVRGGGYLDPEEAAARAAEVAREGG